MTTERRNGNRAGNVATDIQGQFEDVILQDPEGEIEDAIKKKLENAEAAAAYRKATEAIKEAIPAIEKPTRFVIGESGYVVTASPYVADGFEIPGGQRVRLKIENRNGGD